MASRAQQIPSALRASPYANIADVRRNMTRPHLTDSGMGKELAAAFGFAVFTSAVAVGANRIAGLNPTTAFSAASGPMLASMSAAQGNLDALENRQDCRRLSVSLTKVIGDKHLEISGKFDLWQSQGDAGVRIAAGELHQLWELLHQWEAVLLHLPREDTKDQWRIRSGYVEELTSWCSKMHLLPTAPSKNAKGQIVGETLGLHSDAHAPALGSAPHPDLLHHVKGQAAPGPKMIMHRA